MRKVILQGFLGDKYGTVWDIDANTYPEVFSCIEANYPTFRKDLIEFAEAGGDLDIQTGDKFIEVDDMLYPIENNTIIITPVPTGAKSGQAKILAAIAIITIAVIASGGLAGLGAVLAGGSGTLAQFAAFTAVSLSLNLAITGIQQLLAPDPSVDTNDQDYLFSGPENTVASGNVVPVLFGEMIVGGVVMSSGIGASYGSYGHIGFGSGTGLSSVLYNDFYSTSPYIQRRVTGVTTISPFAPPTFEPGFTIEPSTPFLEDVFTITAEEIF
jgi:predicted phage tail protein